MAKEDTHTQRLPTRNADTCEKCGNRVHFSVVQTQPTAQGNFRIAHLKCPVCGHPATQLVEVATTRRKAHAIVGGRVF